MFYHFWDTPFSEDGEFDHDGLRGPSDYFREYCESRGIDYNTLSDDEASRLIREAMRDWERAQTPHEN